jgi:hypothetical protein
MSGFSTEQIAAVFGKGVVTLRVSNENVDTPVPPKLLFTVSELRQQLAKRPGMTWKIVEHENAQNFTTERYDLIDKIRLEPTEFDADIELTFFCSTN